MDFLPLSASQTSSVYVPYYDQKFSGPVYTTTLQGKRKMSLCFDSVFMSMEFGFPQNEKIESKAPVCAKCNILKRGMRTKVAL